jgi:hypothetical protein
MNEVFMYAAFGDPAARAAATAKAVKRKKQQSESEKGQEKEEEKMQTPYSIFNEKEMDEKIVRFPFIPFFFLFVNLTSNPLPPADETERRDRRARSPRCGTERGSSETTSRGRSGS